MSEPRAWQRMLSGRRLNLLDPSPLDIEIEDIAHGLARVARWNGQTCGEHSFSVAQHSVLVEAVARNVNQELSCAALMSILLHDAAEYVIGDMITPLKSVISPTYKAIENRLMQAIYARFGLPAEPSNSVTTLIKQADTIAAFHEATQLAGFESHETETLFGKKTNLPKQCLVLLEPLSTQAAQALFLERFHALERE